MALQKSIPSSSPWKFFKKVLPQHTDHAGVMWHGSYIAWCEEARIDALSQVGVDYHSLSSKGFELPVVSLNIKYQMPLLLGDKVLLSTNLLPQNGIRWHWLTTFFKMDNSKVAEVKVDLVLMHLKGSQRALVRTLPDDLKLIFDKLQSGNCEDNV